MKENKKVIAVLVVFAVMLSPAYAMKIGSQSFQKINFNDDTLNAAEIDSAETSFNDAGTLPDNPMYFMKKLGENIKLAFAFSDESKARLHLEFAQARLAEAKQLLAENKTDIARDVAGEFDDDVNALTSEAKNINNTALTMESDTLLKKSSIMLAYVLENAPDSAKPALEHALNNTIMKRMWMHYNETYDNETDDNNTAMERGKMMSEMMRVRNRGHDNEGRTDDNEAEGSDSGNNQSCFNQTADNNTFGGCMRERPSVSGNFRNMDEARNEMMTGRSITDGTEGGLVTGKITEKTTTGMETEVKRTKEVTSPSVSDEGGAK